MNKTVISTASDEMIIAALLSNPTVTAAAKQLDITTATIYNRLKDETFADEYNQRKRELLDNCSSAIQASILQAVVTVRDIMVDQENAPQIRLNAAQILLTQATKFDAVVRSNYKEDNPFAIF